MSFVHALYGELMLYKPSERAGMRIVGDRAALSALGRAVAGDADMRDLGLFTFGPGDRRTFAGVPLDEREDAELAPGHLYLAQIERICDTGARS